MKNYLTILTLSLVFAACGGSTEQHDAMQHETEAVAVPAAEVVTLPDTLVATPDSLGAMPDTTVAMPDTVAAEVDAEG